MKWFIGTLLLLLAALILESGLLAFAMYVLLALLVLSRFLAHSWIGHLTANRQCKQVTAEVGETVAIEVKVTNTGGLPVPWVLLEDMLPAKALVENRSRLRVKKRRFKIASVKAHGEIALNYEIEFLPVKRIAIVYRVGSRVDPACK